jgi:hypothetical protein
MGTRSLEPVEFRPGLRYGQPVDPRADRRRRKRRLRWLALVALVTVAAVAGVVLVDRLTPVSSPYEGVDELAEAIEQAGYECRGDDRLFSTDFPGGTLDQGYCDLHRDGRRITRGAGLELEVFTPPDARQAFVEFQRERTSHLDALVGENWFIIGLGRDVDAHLRQVRDDLLEELPDARVGKYPTGLPDAGELTLVTRPPHRPPPGVPPVGGGLG